MITQTMTRHDIHTEIDALSDAAIERLAPYVSFLRYEDHENKPRIPNSETIAAIEECRARKGKRASSVEEFFEAMHNVVDKDA